MSKNYVTIIDNTGRNILGTLNKETDTEITINDPVMILVQPQNGQFQVQLIPLFLAEFIAPNEKTSRHFSFTFNKANIAVGNNFDIDAKITTQYDRVIEVANAVQAPKNAEPEVIKLFDE